MRILVTFAVEAEFSPWRKKHNFARISMPTPIGLQSQCFYRGTAFDNDVEVLLTGIGWEESKTDNRPRYVLRELLKNRPDVCISTGLAGGLKEDLQVGDIVAAKQISLRTSGDTYRSSEALLALAKDAGAKTDLRQITETHIVAEASAKAGLSGFGDFVDMEGYHILKIVSGTRIPAISIRAISDAHDTNVPAEIGKIIDVQGHVKTMPLLKLALKRPDRIPSLITFGSQSQYAARRLADFLDRFLEVAGGNKSEAQAKRAEVAAR
jgi:nucleoside phosphorylase